MLVRFHGSLSRDLQQRSGMLLSFLWQLLRLCLNIKEKVCGKLNGLKGSDAKLQTKIEEIQNIGLSRFITWKTTRPKGAKKPFSN